MWSIKHTATSTATPWQLWSDPSSWPFSDHTVSQVDLKPFIEGSRGILKPVSGPSSKLELTSVEPMQSFTTNCYQTSLGKADI